MGVLVICVLVFTVFCTVGTVFFVLFRLCIFILISFVCTSVKDYCHRVTTQLQLVIIIITIKILYGYMSVPLCTFTIDYTELSAAVLLAN